MTAEKFFKNNNGVGLVKSFYHPDEKQYVDIVSVDKAIEFAKYHVEKALQEAALNADTTHVGMGLVVVDSETIINAYPLNNIK